MSKLLPCTNECKMYIQAPIPPSLDVVVTKASSPFEDVEAIQRLLIKGFDMYELEDAIEWTDELNLTLRKHRENAERSIEIWSHYE